MGEIKHFCSLGTICHTARMMQRVHVKRVSYPFDWIFTDDEIIIDILNDDFNKFLDKSYYTDVKNKYSERTCGHTFYHEDFFFHKNPRNEEDHLYYQRCVERFRDLTKNGESKLFIMMFSPESTNHPTYMGEKFKNGIDKEVIIQELKQRGRKLNEVLRTKTSNYKLLIVMNFGNNPSQSFNMEWEGNLHFLTLNTLSHSGGVTFNDNMDNLFYSGIISEHYFR